MFRVGHRLLPLARKSKAALYKYPFCRNCIALYMDKFWSICAMPIGLMLCFTPILIAWVQTEARNRSEKNRGRK